MDFIKEALTLGFNNAAVIDVKDLVFVLEYRQFCEETGRNAPESAEL